MKLEVRKAFELNKEQRIKLRMINNDSLNDKRESN